MRTGRLEAFSDGVLAILITIMVLELKPPDGTRFADLRDLIPVFLSYILSFVYLGIYWNNHHHLLQASERVNGGILWANLHLLFWLSLFPFTTAWMGEHHFATVPAATYGVVAVGAALAYFLLQTLIVREQGVDSKLATALGSDLKGKVSPVLYLAAVPLAFANHWIAVALYVLVALMWLVPDRRVAQVLDPTDPTSEV
jgi:uncharacterized membrane protein